MGRDLSVPSLRDVWRDRRGHGDPYIIIVWGLAYWIGFVLLTVGVAALLIKGVADFRKRRADGRPTHMSTSMVMLAISGLVVVAFMGLYIFLLLRAGGFIPA